MTTQAFADPSVRLTLMDEGVGHFDITVLPAVDPSCVALFAPGGGGNPDRYRGLLTALTAAGCMVVAPHFARIEVPEPEDSLMLLWARRLSLALGAAASPDLPVAGVGSSIGCAVLLALAGGQMSTRTQQQLPIAPNPRLDRLALLSAPTGWFQAPGALEAVSIPIMVWAGSKDEVTPPAQAQFLKETLEPRVPVDMRIVADAAHCSFMSELPPGVVDTLPQRDSVLAEMAAEVARFVTQPRA